MYLEKLEGPAPRGAQRVHDWLIVPALWDVLHRRIETQVQDRGEAAHLAFTSMLRFSRFLREKYGVNLGPMAFSEVHKMLGGRIRHLIVCAALSDPVLNAFEGLGLSFGRVWADRGGACSERAPARRSKGRRERRHPASRRRYPDHQPR